MKLKSAHILIAIVIIGFFLRFYKLSTNFMFSIDQSEDLYRLQEIYEVVKSGRFQDLPIKGEAGTDNSGTGIPLSTYSVYTGVFYFYFLLPIAVLVSFSPLGLTIFFALLNLASIPLIYFLGKELFNKKTGLVAAFLYSTSYWINAFSRTIWTPSPVPVFVLVSIYLLTLIKRGRVSFWPLFTFCVAALSQIHDSGYYYSGFFLLLLLFLKLPSPKKMSNWIFTVFCFFVPIFPTILNEFITGFKFVPQVVEAFNAGAQYQSFYLSDLLHKFWNFWTTSINPWQYNSYIKDVYGVTGAVIQILFLTISIILLVGGLFLLKKKNFVKIIFIIFLATFFALPYLAKVYYLDNSLGLVFWGAAFSLVGSLPLIFLWQAYVIDLIWDNGKFGKFLSILILTCFAAINIFTESNHIWEKRGDPRFNYEDKLKIVAAIKRDVGDKKYSLNYIDQETDGGKEFLYLLDYSKTEKPVRFKGNTHVGSSLIEYNLPIGEAEVDYVIATRSNWDGLSLSGQLLLQSGDLKLFKSH